MKRTRIVVASALASTVALCAALPASAQDFKIDPGHSLTYFEVNHLGLSNYRGRFDETTGTATLDLKKKQGSLEVTINMNSVSTGVAKLDEHLKKKDFFDVENHPTATFKSTRFKFDDDEDEVEEIEGNLTLRGVTRPVKLKVTNFTCKPHPMMKKMACGGNAETTIKRMDFGVNYGVPAVGEEVKIYLQVEAIAQ